MASGSGDPTYNPSVPRWIVALALTLAGCSAGVTQNPAQAPTQTATQSAPQTACEAAMAKAAAVDEMQDTIRDLDDAIRACKTVGEMQDANGKYPTALDGVPPIRSPGIAASPSQPWPTPRSANHSHRVSPGLTSLRSGPISSRVPTSPFPKRRSPSTIGSAAPACSASACLPRRARPTTSTRPV
jgi:hypothetical protein